jgi:CreA protein
MSKVQKLSGAVLGVLLVSGTVNAEEVGSVDTKFNLLSPDDSVRIEVFDDPKVAGVACYLSRAVTGGFKGAVGVAEDTSDASLDCRQVGPIQILQPLEEEERVFRERRSLIFKSLKVVRFCDSTRNVLVYLVYSERVVEGSPKNSVSTVPIGHWSSNDGEEPLARCEYD